MLVLNSRLNHVPVMSLQSGSALGETTDVVIDPRKLQIVAFYVAGPRITNTSVLHVSDIREFGKLGFIVDRADSVMSLDDDLIRLQEVIRFNFSLLGKPVIDDQKQKLGKVAEFTVDTEGFYIQKLHIAQSMLKNITSSNLVIHRSQIVEVTDHHIIVRSATITEPVSLTQVLNPFRRTRAATPEA